MLIKPYYPRSHEPRAVSNLKNSKRTEPAAEPFTTSTPAWQPKGKKFRQILNFIDSRVLLLLLQLGTLKSFPGRAATVLSFSSLMDFLRIFESRSLTKVLLCHVTTVWYGMAVGTASVEAKKEAIFLGTDHVLSLIHI